MGDVERFAGVPIALAGVSVERRGMCVLDGVDLVIPGGRRTVILGANGAGKTTLLKVLHGLVAPTHGKVSWGEFDAAPGRQAMVFQRPVLLRRSALANVLHALALAGIRGTEARVRAHEALQSVGLAAIGHRSARVLSGGEQQRLALARALALAPELVLLDEPTSSLDPAAARSVEAFVSGIHARGTTVVMTTHRLGEARRLADGIVMLAEGRVTEHTPAARFFETPVSEEGRLFLEGERS
ncbi:MAG: ATP-binding cassette domain-containing protein [Proteobacteria bacterium]|jgi:tungstate transport system ATP-binding protein|nr:ATP-binding cassette domain-containing protein [Pseudomonadota bacterium]